MTKEILLKEIIATIDSHVNEYIYRESMVKDLEDDINIYASHKHGVSGKLPTEDEIRAQAYSTIPLPEESCLINTVHENAFVNGARWIISKMSEVACASGAGDTVAEGRECRQSVMCDVWNVTGYCSCCGGRTSRGISDEEQP